MARNSGLLFLSLLGLYIVVVSCFDENLVQQWPKNTAIRVGEDRKLTCTMKPGISYKLVIWQMTPYSDHIEAIYTGTKDSTDVEKKWTDKFEPAPSSPHDIVIKNAELDHGGRYICSVKDQGGDTKPGTSSVTVLEKSTCTSGDGDVKEDGQTVFLDCSVKYKSHDTEPFLPDIKWYDETDSEVRGGSYIEPEIPEGDPTPPPTDPKIRLYRLNKTATGDDDGKIFQCRISFVDDDYSDTCNTSFRVQYGVTGVTFDPDYIDGEEPLKRKFGDFINCTAGGNPAPTYTWKKLSLDGGGEQIVRGSQLQMTEDMIGTTNEYECTAKNTIKGQPKSLSRTVKFDVTMTVNAGSISTFSLMIIILAGVVGVLKQF